MKERGGEGGKGGIDVEIYPKAGHQISGTGTSPVWLYADANDNLDGLREGRDVQATGHATTKAWTRMIGFLKRTLD